MGEGGDRQGQRKSQVTILGSGTSMGVPMVGCHCSVCRSSDPKNKRLRTSLYLQTAKRGLRILVDTTPDLRAQLLTHRIERVDAVIITHGHADHIHGIDDLRPLCFVGPSSSSPPHPPPPRKIPLFTSKRTAESLMNRFSYIFPGSDLSLLDLHILEEGPHSQEILGESFHFFLLPHGPVGTAMGFLHGKFAYLIDCHEIPEPTLKRLREAKLDLLIIDCVRHAPPPHPTHLTVEKTFSYIERIAPQRAGLIHMGHQLEHHALAEETRKAFDFPVFPVYDGLQLQLHSFI